MTARDLQPEDQDKSRMAYIILHQFIQSHRDKIEVTLWTSAMLAFVITSAKASNVPMNEFKEHVVKAIEHYWNEKD